MRRLPRLSIRLFESLRHRPAIWSLIGLVSGLCLAEAQWLSGPLIAVLCLAFSLALNPRWIIPAALLALGFYRYWFAVGPAELPRGSVQPPIVAQCLEDAEPTRNGHRALARVSDRHKAYLYLNGPWDRLPERGQWIEIARPLTPIIRTRMREPYLRFLIKRRIAYTASLYPGDLKILSPPDSGLAARMADSRRAFRTRLRATMPERTAAVAEGVILGAGSDFPKRDRERFARSGLAHMLSASGLHVGVAALIVTWLTGLLPLPFWSRRALILAAVWLYAAMAGFNPPIVRAAIMISAWAIAPLIWREFDGLSALACAAVVWLIIAPNALWEAGFRLSFAAMIGILMLYIRTKRPLESALRALPWRPRRFIAGGAAVSVAALIGLLPVQASTFGFFPVMSIAANLLASPALPIVIFGGAVAAIWPWLGGAIADLGSRWILFVADRLGDATAPVLALPALPDWAILAYLALLLALAPEPATEDPLE